MRTFTIAFSAAFVFLLSQQLTAADDRHDREGRGASQAVVAGTLICSNSTNLAVLHISGGIGVFGLPISTGGLGQSINVFSDISEHSEDCLDLLPALAEQVPHICEFGSTFTGDRDNTLRFVCTGRADPVISAVGKMARAVTRLGQP